MYVRAPSTWIAHGGHNRVLDILHLELQVVESYHVGTGSELGSFGRAIKRC